MKRFASLVSLTMLLQFLPAIAQAQEAGDPIQQVVEAGLMTNFQDGNFYPEKALSRAELATILVKTFKLDKRAAAQKETVLEVPDVPASHWASNDIQVVLKTGIMNGYRDGMFFPNQRVSRAEAFAIFAQAHGVFQFPDENVAAIMEKYPDSATIPAWAKKSMATALYEGFVNTDATNSINPLNPMTRADMAYALSQYLERQQRPASVPNAES